MLRSNSPSKSQSVGVVDAQFAIVELWIEARRWHRHSFVKKLPQNNNKNINSGTIMLFAKTLEYNGNRFISNRTQATTIKATTTTTACRFVKSNKCDVISDGTMVSNVRTLHMAAKPWFYLKFFFSVSVCSCSFAHSSRLSDDVCGKQCAVWFEWLLYDYGIYVFVWVEAN